MVTLLLKRDENCASISILLATEKFLAAVKGRKLQNESFGIKEETTRQWTYSEVATEH
jgi:hypothetical protein